MSASKQPEKWEIQGSIESEPYSTITLLVSARTGLEPAAQNPCLHFLKPFTQLNHRLGRYEVQRNTMAGIVSFFKGGYLI
jgi:hypothetical protein